MCNIPLATLIAEFRCQRVNSDQFVFLAFGVLSKLMTEKSILSNFENVQN